MKRIILGVLAVSAILCGCQKNSVQNFTQESTVLQATIGDINSTKTAMDSDNNIIWSEGDQVVAFMKTSLGLKYQIKNEYIGKAYGYFSLVSSGSSNDLGAGTEWDHNIVYYPYSETVECLKSDDNYALKVVLPSEQTYAPESFGEDAMAMVAVSEDNNITFRNILGGIKLQFIGIQAITSITIKGNNEEKLSGAASVTAYSNGTKPAISMSTSASSSVTLKCSNDIQLSESKATPFIIALPPVFFSKGFTVTVTDTNGKKYEICTDKANTVLRSSLMVMPVCRLDEEIGKDEPDESTVKRVFIDRTSLTMVPNTSYTFITEVDPFDAVDKDLIWSSSAPDVATVNQNGMVTAITDGTAVISAIAPGGASASCTTIVSSCTATADIDYVDEYGINHGKGIVIGDIVWAPVNCGYKEASDNSKGYPYGKLYQWGRKYGHGYSDEYDESIPDIVEGPVLPSEGLSEDNADKFYYNPGSPNDWSVIMRNDLWNSGTDDLPVKTEYDPCPKGWRVPTYSELSYLQGNRSSWTTVNNQKGYYFSGEYSYLDDAPQIFFPAAGCRISYNGKSDERNRLGRYWSTSAKEDDKSHFLVLHNTGSPMSFCERAYGYSIRCVQE